MNYKEKVPDADTCKELYQIYKDKGIKIEAQKVYNTTGMGIALKACNVENNVLVYKVFAPDVSELMKVLPHSIWSTKVNRWANLYISKRLDIDDNDMIKGYFDDIQKGYSISYVAREFNNEYVIEKEIFNPNLAQAIAEMIIFLFKHNYKIR